jgi:four helix bundle protein
MDQRTKEFKRRIYQYVLRIVKFLTKLPNDPVCVELKRQLTKSGTSVGANYFEAQSGSSRKDYKKFFEYSLKSPNESCFWLALLRDSGFVTESLIQECNDLLQESKELAKIFASSVLTLKSKNRI